MNLHGSRLVFLIAISLFLACLPENDTPEAGQTKASEHLEAAKNLLRKRPLTAADIGSLDRHLAEIAPDDPEFKYVPALKKEVATAESRLVEEFVARRRSEASAARQAYVEEVERHYLENGFDIQLNASGPENSVLTFKFASAARPLADRLSNSESFLTGLRGRGFKKVVFNDASDASWSVDFD